jgi:hypothetical protein
MVKLLDERQTFLAKYYIANAIHSRIRGRLNALVLNRSAARWDSLRATVAGHDTWLVVGNGPSLKADDLTALRAIPSVASNKINLLFDKTPWRPTLYNIADPLLLYKLPAAHFDDFDLSLLPHTVSSMAKTRNKLVWRMIPDDEGRRKYLEGAEELSPLNGFISGASITNPNLMFAMWAGAKTIYLIGCDHFYANEGHKDGTRKTAHPVAQSHHFHPDYRKPGEIVNAAPIEWMNRGYALLRTIADKRGVRIINISRQTALEAFERGTVEEAVAHIQAR